MLTNLLLLLRTSLILICCLGDLRPRLILELVQKQQAILICKLELNGAIKLHRRKIIRILSQLDLIKQLSAHTTCLSFVRSVPKGHRLHVELLLDKHFSVERFLRYFDAESEHVDGHEQNLLLHFCFQHLGKIADENRIQSQVFGIATIF